MNKTHTDTHMQKPHHTRLPTYTHTHMSTHKSMRAYTHTQPLIHTGIHTNICTRTCMHTHTLSYTPTNHKTSQIFTNTHTRKVAQAHTKTHRERNLISHEQNAHNMQKPDHTRLPTYTHEHTQEHARIHTHTNIDTNRHTQKHLHTHMHAHTRTYLHTYKPRHLANIHKHPHGRSLLRVRAHTHTCSSAHIRIMRLHMQWAPLLYTHCSPLTRTPSFSSADDPMTRCGGLGLRGEMATPMRQGVWCLLPVVLNAVPIHTQCSDHYLRDEASWL